MLYMALTLQHDFFMWDSIEPLNGNLVTLGVTETPECLLISLLYFYHILEHWSIPSFLASS